MSAPSTKPILIAGAGTTGLALALTLAQSRIPVRIIEKDAQFHVGDRGSGLQPRTLELYHFLGVLPDIMAGGKPVGKRCVYEMPEGRTPARILDLAPWEEPTPSVPFKNMWIIGQSHNEKILRSHLAKLGVHVELNTELRSFEQSETGVTTQVIKRDGSKEIPETISASYLVGADGGKSTVRKQLGFTFLGETREEDRMLLADLEITGVDANYWHFWGDKSSSTLHLRPTEYDGLFSCILSGRDLDFQSMSNDPQALFKCIREISNRPELEFGNVKWTSEWRPNIRMTNKFSEGRVFIAGDAGHTHSPTGGQGLNSGFQDAYNLAWKLSLVYKGLADPSLLESYNEERLPVIAEMLGLTTAMLDQVTKPKGDGSNAARHVRSKILHQLGVNCRWSSIVVDEQPEAKDVSNAGAYLAEDPTVLYAGDRAPDAPGLLNVADASAKPASLFNIFGPTHHTALVFVANAEQAAPVLRSLEGYPEGTVTKVVVLPKDVAKSTVAPGADLTLVDQEGHAHTAYPPVSTGFSVIVVRPDGVVGAIVKDAQGVKRYLDVVLVRN